MTKNNTLPLPPETSAKLRAGFDAFLQQEGYKPLTADKSCMALHRMLELCFANQPLTDKLKVDAVRALRWHREERQLPPNLHVWLERELAGEEIEDAAPKAASKKLDKLSPAQWAALEKYVSQEIGLKAQITRVAMHCPLRIGKILDTPLQELKDKVRNEAVKEAILNAQKARIHTFGESLASSPNAARVAMERYTHELSRALGFSFDFNGISRTRQDLPRIP